MSQLVQQEQRFGRVRVTSALPLKADIHRKHVSKIRADLAFYLSTVAVSAGRRRLRSSRMMTTLQENRILSSRTTLCRNK
jgi:hypothetical protein